MDRRTFLKTTTAAAATSTAVVSAQAGQTARESARDNVHAPNIVASRCELQVAVPTAPHLADAALQLTRDIEIASGGRIILHRTARELAPPARMIGANGLDGAFGALPDICSAPELSIFTGLPGDLALPPDDLLVWLEAAGGAMLLDERSADYGLTSFITAHSGAQTGLWASNAVSDLRTFAAADISTYGLGSAVVAHLRSAFGQPFETDEEAAVSLIELSAEPLQGALQLPAPTRTIWYRDGLHQQGTATALVLARDVWHRLPPGDQKLIETVTRAAVHNSLAQRKASDRLFAPAIWASLPTKRIPLPIAVSQAIRHTATQVCTAALTSNPTIDKIYRAYSAFFEASTGTKLATPTNQQSAPIA